VPWGSDAVPGEGWRSVAVSTPKCCFLIDGYYFSEFEPSWRLCEPSHRFLEAHATHDGCLYKPMPGLRRVMRSHLSSSPRSGSSFRFCVPSFCSDCVVICSSSPGLHSSQRSSQVCLCFVLFTFTYRAFVLFYYFSSFHFFTIFWFLGFRM
jgi:hypothetical protein